MSQLLEQEGVFRGEITSYELTKAKSGAVGVSLMVAIHDISYEGEWCDYREHDLQVPGDFWVVGKDGTANEYAVDPLMEHAGWDGSFASLTGKTWKPRPVAVTVGRDEYKDQVRFKIDWLNQYDGEPGASRVSADDAMALDMKFGSSMRAKAGNFTRNDSAPSGKPAKSKPKSKPKAPPEPVTTGPPDEEIPF